MEPRPFNLGDFGDSCCRAAATLLSAVRKTMSWNLDTGNALTCRKKTGIILTRIKCQIRRRSNETQTAVTSPRPPVTADGTGEGNLVTCWRTWYRGYMKHSDKAKRIWGKTRRHRSGHPSLTLRLGVERPTPISVAACVTQVLHDPPVGSRSGLMALTVLDHGDSCCRTTATLLCASSHAESFT